MKQVELKIEIDESGKVHVEPNGTQGSECLELMDFIEKIPGFEVVETVKNDDFKTKKVQLNTVQKVSR